MYKFNWTCDEFDEWMKEKEAALNPDADMLDAEAAKVRDENLILLFVAVLLKMVVLMNSIGSN